MKALLEGESVPVAVLDLPSPVLFSERMIGLIMCESAQTRRPQENLLWL